MKEYFLVLDAGTSSIKAFLFNNQLEIIETAHSILERKISHDGAYVEQDPQAMVSASYSVLREVVKKSGIVPNEIQSMGITNQRETIVAWDKNSGKTEYPAIVWQDTRTENICHTIENGDAKIIREKTGLFPLPYFSVSKIQWLNNNGYITKKSLCGTIDSWLLWNLLENHPHVTDATNAARTLLWNIHTGIWDDELLNIWGMRKELLPSVLSSQSFFGNLNSEILGIAIPVRAVCGDQQSSWYAASSLRNVSTKITFGTGIFMVQGLKGFALYPDFFTTIVPEKNKKIHYSIEMKIADVCGPRVTPHLGDENALRPLMKEFAKLSAKAAQKLPYKPESIVIDGGVTQSDILVSYLEEYLSDTKIIRQHPYEGTALGVACLLRDNINYFSR